MRYFLNVLFALALLPALAKAAPYVEYNPATGDIRIREISEIRFFIIYSASGALNPDITTAGFEINPPGLPRPAMRLDPMASRLDVSTKQDYIFPFTSLTIFNAISPGTPVSDITYLDGYRTTSSRSGEVIEVPEPASLAMGATGLLAPAALRRRW